VDLDALALEHGGVGLLLLGGARNVDPAEAVLAATYGSDSSKIRFSASVMRLSATSRRGPMPLAPNREPYVRS
jgi:hypothetical protein